MSDQQNYCQLELGGKLRGLKFNQISMEVFLKTMNWEAPDQASIYSTFYGGLVGNCVAKREEQDFTFENVMDWVDKLHEEKKQDEIKKVCDMWSDTHTWKDWLLQFQEKLRILVKPEETKDNKKKVTKTMTG